MTNDPNILFEELSDDELTKVTGGATLAEVNLQGALQKQQQSLVMLSNISKMQHDTAMSIIRKIG